MGFVQRELERIECALHEPQSSERYCQLYAAQQALSWTLEPSGFASSYETIVSGKVHPLIKDTQADSEDCSAVPHRSAS